MNSVIRKIEERSLRKDIPQFRVGDSLRLQVRVVEGEKERIQPFEGIVIKMNRGGNRAGHGAGRSGPPQGLASPAWPWHQLGGQ